MNLSFLEPKMDESFVLLQPTDADDMPPNEYPSTFAANQVFTRPSIPWQDVEFHLFEPFSRITQASLSALDYCAFLCSDVVILKDNELTREYG